MPSAVLNRIMPYLIPLALAVSFYVLAGHFDVVSRPGHPGPDLWPRMICVMLGIASFIGLIGALFESGDPVADHADKAALLAEAPETRPELVWIGIAIVGIYIFALPYLGFFVATTMLAMALLVTGGMRNLALVPIAGLLLASGFSVVFLRIVYVGLPLGEGWFRTISLMIYKLIGVH